MRSELLRPIAGILAQHFMVTAVGRSGALFGGAVARYWATPRRISFEQHLADAAREPAVLFATTRTRQGRKI
jgi:hypothetical protein